MKDLERIKTRYLKDPWPTRLAGIAADLGRVTSHWRATPPAARARRRGWKKASKPQQRTILSAQAKVWADQILELVGF